MARSGIEAGDRVAALFANSHIMLELHQAVLARGAVLVSINVRLAVEEMRYIFEHSGVRLLVATGEFAAQAKELAEHTGRGGDGALDEYESWLPETTSTADRIGVDERDLLAINYTLGDGGWGYSRLHARRRLRSDLEAVPRGRRHEPQCRADRSDHDRGGVWCERALPPCARRHRGAPPSPALLQRLDLLGFDVTHLYGLTETFGPVAVNVWQPEWDKPRQRPRDCERQGIGNIIARPLRVLDPSGVDTPPDGQAMGEIAVRATA